MSIDEILAAATPRPWCLTPAEERGSGRVRANAELKVLAVNSYERQRECIRALAKALQSTKLQLLQSKVDEYKESAINEAIAALARAKELL